ncbi:glutenin, high molecular weight subunit PW212 [Nilaparvata lugens]|uniref:glutenin, high molecular weight subunit PW212 n=1 Tax=Nilaparvata lugens TaxID=108931 RepID=UPI00193E8CAB|nr:glutenin, high molecular weight subunit PW212 [Nilaparvata lugens]
MMLKGLTLGLLLGFAVVSARPSKDTEHDVVANHRNTRSVNPDGLKISKCVCDESLEKFKQLVDLLDEIKCSPGSLPGNPNHPHHPHPTGPGYPGQYHPGYPGNSNHPPAPGIPHSGNQCPYQPPSGGQGQTPGPYQPIHQQPYQPVGDYTNPKQPGSNIPGQGPPQQSIPQQPYQPVGDYTSPQQPGNSIPGQGPPQQSIPQQPDQTYQPVGDYTNPQQPGSNIPGQGPPQQSIPQQPYQPGSGPSGQAPHQTIPQQPNQSYNPVSNIPGAVPPTNQPQVSGPTPPGSEVTQDDDKPVNSPTNTNINDQSIHGYNYNQASNVNQITIVEMGDTKNGNESNQLQPGAGQSAPPSYIEGDDSDDDSITDNNPDTIIGFPDEDSPSAPPNEIESDTSATQIVYGGIANQNVDSTQVNNNEQGPVVTIMDVDAIFDSPPTNSTPQYLTSTPSSPSTPTNQGSPQTPTQGSPQQPTQGSPQQPTQGYPQQPTQGSPQQPTQGSPQQPTQGYPQQPTQGSPQQPTQGSPQQPTQGSPQQPTQGYPQQPTQGSPQQPTQGSPQQPTQGYPQQPTQGSPQQPTQGSPQQPTQGSPQQPSQGYPQQPTQGYPQQPTQGYPQQPTQGSPQQPTQGYPQQPTQGSPQSPTQPGNSQTSYISSYYLLPQQPSTNNIITQTDNKSQATNIQFNPTILTTSSQQVPVQTIREQGDVYSPTTTYPQDLTGYDVLYKDSPTFPIPGIHDEPSGTPTPYKPHPGGQETDIIIEGIRKQYYPCIEEIEFSGCGDVMNYFDMKQISGTPNTHGGFNSYQSCTKNIYSQDVQDLQNELHAQHITLDNIVATLKKCNCFCLQ